MMLPALLLAVAPTPVPVQAPPVFRASTEVVRVEALVTDGRRVVRGLTAADFEVKDNGVRQRLSSVSFEEVPVDVLLVLDVSQSVRGRKLSALRDAASALVDELGPDDRVALVGFRERTALEQGFTENMHLVREALDRLEGAGSTALYDAVYAAMHLWEPGNRRRALVVFSDGLDNLSWLPPREVVETAAEWTDATVYAVAVRGPGERSEPFLRDVARATGGRTWEARDERDLRQRFLEALQDIRARYLLTYTPEGSEREGWHEIKVRVRGRRGDVLARPGYRRSKRPER